MNQLRSAYSMPKEAYTNQYTNKNKIGANYNFEKNPSEAGGQIQGAFNRMNNIGQTDSFGGRMGELEQASMRLAGAASKRRIGEMEKEYEIKNKASTGAEKSSLESEARSLKAKRALTFEERERLNQINRQLGMLK